MRVNEDIQYAILYHTGKGYRKRCNRYSVGIPISNGTQIHLGTFDTEKEAREVVYNFKLNRLISKINEKYLNINECKVTNNKYIIFKNGMLLNLYGNEIKGNLNSNGYFQVKLNGKYIQLHRIVAEAFINNTENKPYVNHIDGNKKNNNVDNLEWCTHCENIQHAIKTGLLPIKYGDYSNHHKLTFNDVKYIKENYIKGSRDFGYSGLGKMFNVDKTTIYCIIKGKTWREN